MGSVRLKEDLGKALSGWPPEMVQSIVDTVTGDAPRSEVEDMVQNFLPGETSAIAIISKYLAGKDAASGGGRTYVKPARDEPAQLRGGGTGSNRGSATSATAATSAAAASSSSAASGGEAGRQLPQQQQQASGKVLGMFKEGGRLPKPAVAPGGSSGKGGGGKGEKEASLVAQLERKVVNCLGCGKIYDCRVPTADIATFLEGGGKCTYCGDKVALTYGDWSAQQDASAAAAAAMAAEGEDAATAAARAFKDRLVEYDRNAAQRTTVIDDQNDYFEIDSNAWLSDQERAEMRQRKKMEDEAEAAKKGRLTVTIDLVGRRVIQPSADAVDGGAAGFETSASVAAAREEQAAAARARDAAAAQAAPWREAAPRHGIVASAEQLSKAVEALRLMKVTINPHLATGSAPVFTPAAGAAGAAGAAPSGARGSGSSSSRTGPGVARDRRPAAPAAAGGRLQGDLFEAFDEFGLEVMYADAIEAAAAMEPQFDLCPPEMHSGGMAPIVVPLKRTAAEVASTTYTPLDQLPPGMTLLKGFLSVQQQADLVNELRPLGMGPGGFYTPSYKEGGRLALRMMCLGQHWEPRLHAYESSRSAHDSATPPPLPASLCQLCADILRASEFATGFRQPGPFVPDVCLVNHYEKTGRLGYHQDKDETPESLRRQLPVVSLSIGDAADFIFGSTPNEAEAGRVRLESGDALVFGGPSRMVFHAVPTIHAGTVPRALVDACGLRPGRLNLTIRQV